MFIKKRFSIVILLSFLFCLNLIFSFSGDTEKYQDRFSYSFEGFVGEEIEIKKNGTFNYNYWTDIARKSTKGKWVILDSGVLHAKSFNEQKLSTISSEIRENSEKIKISIVDLETNKPISGVLVLVECDKKNYKITSNVYGKVFLDDCPLKRFYVESLNGWEDAKYEVVDNRENVFMVKMAPTELVINEYFFFFEGKLFPLRMPFEAKKN